MSRAGGPAPPSDVLKARARLLYTRTAVPVELVARILSLTSASLYRRMPVWGWPRRPAAASERSRLLPPAGRGRRGGIDRRATGEAIERFVAGRIAFHEAQASSGQDPDIERTARTVAHYTRALGLVRSYLADLDREPSTDETGPPARTLSELRDELRGHLDRIRREEAARRRAGRAPGDPA